MRPAATRRPRARAMLFAGICMLSVVLATVYALLAVRRMEKERVAARPAASGPGLRVEALLSRPHLAFRSTALGPDYGKVSVVARETPAGSRSASDLSCEVLHMAADRGLCLSADRGVITTYQASILDAQLRPTRSFPLPGIPSRTRVSPDGRLGALTVFVSGHSYAAFGFSTETRIVDLTSGESLGNLEELAVWKGGRRFQAVDFNFWGVTFAGDGNRFYATLGAGDERYLVTGDAARREMRVLRANVECPSLSPDNRRLVYKKRLSGFGPVRWRLHALDLETMDETPLAETRSVDDQVEWLDDHRVLYALPEEQPSAATNVWVAPADGSADPQLLIRGAASPTVARPAGVLSGPR